MSTKKKKISELKEAYDLHVNDWFVIERPEGTRKIQAGNMGMYEDEIEDFKNKIDKINKFLANKFPISYTKPTLTLSSNKGTKFELGTTINPTITANFTQNDAGVIKQYRLTKGASILTDSLNIQSFTESFKLTGDVQYTAEVSYEKGKVKYDSLGNADLQGHIQEGAIGTTLTITAERASWGYASNSASEPTATNIRRATINNIGLQKGSIIKAVATPGSTRTIIFAYPEYLGSCNKIRYEELGDDANKTAFTKTILSIADASGENYINYIVYYYTSPKPFSSTATFILTI